MVASPRGSRVEALRASLAAPGAALPEVRESHSAWVVLSGDRAYKLKKPVHFAFLDYSTPQARRAACEEEARVNAALAPDLVLGVRALRRSDGAVVLADPDAADAIDWVIVMRRFDEARTMAALLERGELTGELVCAAARRIASFHASAEIVEDPDPCGRVRATIAANVDELGEAAGEQPGEGPAGALGAFLLAALPPRRDDLTARARAGLVRDGHGDLRAEHVVFEDAGVLVVDRIEFDPKLRRIDVGDDLSFLAMDLEACGAREQAELLVEAYRDAGGEPGEDSLISLFGAHRALVRAKVALLRARQDAGSGAEGEAARLLALAALLAWRAHAPLALVVCGPPASGKSSLAEAIGRRSGFAVLSSDRVRKEGLGLPARERAPEPAYGAAARAAVYAELGRRAQVALDAGGGVIVDATFGDPELRASFFGELTTAQRGRLRAVECRAPLAVLAVRAREADRGASDAGPAVAERLARSFQPVTELEPARVTAVDGMLHAARQVTAIEAWLSASREG